MHFLKATMVASSVFTNRVQWNLRSANSYFIIYFVLLFWECTSSLSHKKCHICVFIAPPAGDIIPTQHHLLSFLKYKCFCDTMHGNCCKSTRSYAHEYLFILIFLESMNVCRECACLYNTFARKPFFKVSNTLTETTQLYRT